MTWPGEVIGLMEDLVGLNTSSQKFNPRDAAKVWDPLIASGNAYVVLLIDGGYGPDPYFWAPWHYIVYKGGSTLSNGYFMFRRWDYGAEKIETGVTINNFRWHAQPYIFTK